jgi:hypothetical protein
MHPHKYIPLLPIPCSWSDAVHYFDSHGHSCPLYKNPSDFFLMLASNQDTVKKLADAQVASWAEATGDVETPGLPPRRSISSQSPDSVASMTGTLTDNTGIVMALQKEGSMGPAVPAWYQIWVLTVRFLRSWLRHPLLLASEAGQFVFIAIFLGGYPCRCGCWA